MADRMIFHKTILTGGAADSLDNISGADRGDTNPLQAKDGAFVMESGALYVYLFDAVATDAESSPDIIKPDDIDGADPGRWILYSINPTAAQIATIITGATNETTPLDADDFGFYKATVAALRKVTWANIKATLKAYFDGIYLTAIADESITNAKLAHVATSVIKGRVAAGSGDVEDLSAANVRTIINVADGANAYTHPSGDGNLHVPANSTTNNGKVLTASASAGTYTWETAAGVTYCSAAEINTGTEAAKAVSPDTLAGSNMGAKVVQVVVFDYTTDVATGNGKAYFVVPDELTGMNLVRVAATVITAGVTGSTTIGIYNLTDTHQMLSVSMAIETGETTTRTSATPGTIDAGEDDVVTGDILRIDISAISTTAPKGLIVELVFALP
jgi:hypothetical protein